MIGLLERWGVVVQTLSILASALFIIFWGGRQIGRFEGEIIDIHKTLVQIEKNQDLNRSEHAVIYDAQNRMDRTDTEQTARISTLDKAVAALPPEWLKEAMKNLDDRVRELERAQP